MSIPNVCRHTVDADAIRPYLEDASGFTGMASAVFFPEEGEEVAAVVAAANAANTPVTVSGAGTGLTGGRVAQGGWVLSFERMNRIITIEPGRAVVQPAALLKDVQAAVQARGQFYPPDPTENSSSIGGNIANNSSGSRSFKYGPTRRWVERLKMVLPTGERLEVRRGETRAAGGRLCVGSHPSVEVELPRFDMPAVTKHQAGYFFAPDMDLIDLFIGAEGTLGVITEAELRLVPWPGEALGGVIFFTSDRAALDFVARVRQLSRDSNWSGPVHARLLEYFDRNALYLLRTHRYPEVPAGARSAVLLEQELENTPGDEVADRWLALLGGEHAAGALLDDSWFAISAGEREKFREFRHAIALIVNDTARANGQPKFATDQSVPIPRTEELMEYYQRELNAAFGADDPPQHTMYGHIGDGHLHVNMLPRTAAGGRKARELLLRFAKHAVTLGGTVGAEHGLGKSKAHFLKLLYPPEVLDAMWRIKQALDPLNILNRGNLFTTTPLLEPEA